MRPEAATTAATTWSGGDVENVGACPACGHRERVTLHGDLRDRLFAAPDRWTLMRCSSCRSAYLDPRPTSGSIGRAYDRYMTHGPPTGPLAPAGVTAWLRRAALNGYLARYGYRLSPSSRLGAALIALAPRTGARVDRQIRHMRLETREPRLLDFGCANGEFMLLMRSLGWRVEGLDFDEQAIAHARRAGLAARVGSLADVEPADGGYDAITLGHVVEHLHDPEAELRRAHALLRPGGMIWIATPNVDALGHRAFGGGWFALDAPRHLVLFNADSLAGVLRRAGFARVERLRPTADARAVFRPSLAIRRGLDPLGADPVASSPPLPPSWRARAAAASLASGARPRLAEELIVAAWRDS